MPSNPTGFKFTDTAAGWDAADFDDVFVRKDCFLEGGLWVWGCNVNGMLANNNRLNQSSPVQTISGGTNWRSIDGGCLHSGSIKTDGTLWLWGSNVYGALGDNSIINRSSPVQTVSGGTNWRVLSLGAAVSGSIKTDGTLWIWGRNNNGQLGNNSTLNASSPIQTISGGTNWKSVSLGCLHSAGIKTDGTLWLWGVNGSGRLGNNSTVSVSSPVQTVSGGTNWRASSLGRYHSAAIKTDGTLWLWGSGVALGTGIAYNPAQSSPVQTASGGNNWKSVSAGENQTAAVKTDGSLWLWGTNIFGVLGNNSTESVSSPIQTISGGNNWRAVSTGQLQTAAIKTDGSLWHWGSGILGNNLYGRQSSPVQTISGGTNWRSVTTGDFHILTIREDCW